MTSIIVNANPAPIIKANTESVAIIVVNKGEKGDPGAGGGDLYSANNLSDVANVNTARNNLGAISDEESIVNSLIFG